MIQSHLCSVWKDGQYKRSRKIEEVREGVEEMLRLLQTDYIDVGMIHYVDSLKDWQEIAEGPVLAYARELKEKGIIRHIGLSSHNPQAALAAVKSGAIEVLMFSVNPCYDLQPAAEDVNTLWADASYAGQLVNMNPERQELYETCQRLGVGITVMKAFGGGDLLDEKLSPAGKALTGEPVHPLCPDPPGSDLCAGGGPLGWRSCGPAWPTRRPRRRRRITPWPLPPSPKSAGRDTACTAATAPPVPRK